MSVFARILLAVIVVVAIIALIPPVFRVIGFPLSSDVAMILRICIAAIAAIYIFKGPPLPNV